MSSHLINNSDHSSQCHSTWRRHLQIVACASRD